MIRIQLQSGGNQVVETTPANGTMSSMVVFKDLSTIMLTNKYVDVMNIVSFNKTDYAQAYLITVKAVS